MFKLGVTGTRKTVSREQVKVLCVVLHKLGPGELHHGDCVGSDVMVANMAYGWITVAHPPVECRHRAFHESSVVLPEGEYLKRNRDIVDATEMLLAVPDGPEKLRSGTWSTVRYARKLGRPIVIIYPDGTQRSE